jgi:hypothetical protein
LFEEVAKEFRISAQTVRDTIYYDKDTQLAAAYLALLGSDTDTQKAVLLSKSLDAQKALLLSKFRDK